MDYFRLATDILAVAVAANSHPNTHEKTEEKQEQEREWYDSSTLQKIDNCARIGYWYRLFTIPGQSTSGIADTVGHGALYGTAIHAALEVYYTLRSRKAALNQFAITYERLFGDVQTQPRHSFERGLELLDSYFDFYKEEDKLFTPVEAELAVRIPIVPNNEEKFKPFDYVVRMDMLVERKSYGDIFVWDNKTTSGRLAAMIESFNLDRQTEGYVWAARQLINPPERVKGVIINGILVHNTEADPYKLFAREYFHKTIASTDAWRRETIRKVEAWRRLVNEAATSATPIEVFTRNTARCQDWGRKCPYYTLCQFGPAAVDWSSYAPNQWNPFNYHNME